MARVAVIGAGAWGSALACVARRAGNQTILWARDPALAEAINESGENARYLGGIPLAEGIAATADLAMAVWKVDFLLLAIPAQHMRVVTAAMKPLDGTPAAICAKGVELGTQALMSEILRETLPAVRQAVLSGPTFAAEVARGLPTAVTVAALESQVSALFIEALGAARFRPYASDDPLGAEIGGAVKNVLAIACGITAGRQFGDNARAALITRGMAEIMRLAVAMGGRAQTLMGLSGLGDLTLTCNAMQSRNFSLGVALGEGRSLTDILAGRRAVTEGVYSASAVTALARRRGVAMPICDAVDQVVNHSADVADTITALLNRPFARESSDAD